MLQGAPPLLRQREAAFALVAQGTQQRVRGFDVDFELTAGRLSHRHEDARSGTLIAESARNGRAVRYSLASGSTTLLPLAVAL